MLHNRFLLRVGHYATFMGTYDQVPQLAATSRVVKKGPMNATGVGGCFSRLRGDGEENVHVSDDHLGR